MMNLSRPSSTEIYSLNRRHFIQDGFILCCCLWTNQQQAFKRMSEKFLVMYQAPADPPLPTPVRTTGGTPASDWLPLKRGEKVLKVPLFKGSHCVGRLRRLKASGVDLGGSRSILILLRHPLTYIKFGAQWSVQAEQGGVYQAIASGTAGPNATGIYKGQGLDVTIKIGDALSLR